MITHVNFMYPDSTSEWIPTHYRYACNKTKSEEMNHSSECNNPINEIGIFFIQLHANVMLNSDRKRIEQKYIQKNY